MLVFGCDFNEALKRVAECLGMSGTRQANAFRLPEQELKGVLVVCEGIETAIAIHCINGLNVWACGAANRIAGFRLPEWVKRLIIVADNDNNQTGLQAAQTLQRRYHSALKGNIRIWLPEHDNDVLDLLARQTQNQG